MAHATDIVGYNYRADNHCISCTGKMVFDYYGGSLVPESPDEITAVGIANDIDVEDEYSYDSDDFPKVIFRSHLDGEKCGMCGDCLQCDGWGCSDCNEKIS